MYGADELERLGFISRLKALGLSLAEIRELNAVYRIGGSTQAMLGRLQDLLAAHLDDVDRRMAELEDLRIELVRYRDHVEERATDLDPRVREPVEFETPNATSAGPRASDAPSHERSKQ